MTELPAGSMRDTADLARQYSEVSHWQRDRGLHLLEDAAPQRRETVADIGCGTGELSVELARRVGPSGRVIALDPDPARIARAKAEAPADLPNLTFDQAPAEALDVIEEASVDLVYSNYAIHWVLNQSGMMDEIQKILRPGGRFVAEFLGQPIGPFVELILLMPGGEAIVNENVFHSDAEWHAMIEGRQFETLQFERPEFSLYYDSLGAMFDWLEATSHGAFDVKKLTPDQRGKYNMAYPGEVEVRCRALRLALRRTRK